MRALLLGEMLEAGFSGQLARQLVEDLPADLQPTDGRKWLASAGSTVACAPFGRDTDLIDRGGVFALVGPTGVGKTTTTAKLAARCVVRYGADQLALLTTDGYRIGAHEQLRIYGRILGVPVHVVRDSDDLRRTLSELRDKHMVLIDTVGMSQRDRMVAEQAAMLMRAGDVSRLLLLNATSRGDTLDDVIRCLRRRGHCRLHPHQGRRGGVARAGARCRGAPWPAADLRRQRPARAGRPAPAQSRLPAAPGLQAARKRGASPAR